MEAMEFAVEGSDDVLEVPRSPSLSDMTGSGCLDLQYFTPWRQSHGWLGCFGYLSNSAPSSSSCS